VLSSVIAILVVPSLLALGTGSTLSIPPGPAVSDTSDG
jgi:hypothetical protein